MRRNKKVFAIGDLHKDKHIDIKPVLKFVVDWSPDIIIFGGDMADLDYLSHWNSENFKNIGFDTINKQLLKDAAALREVLKQFMDAGKPKESYYIEGNHERWVTQYLTKYPQVHDMSFKSLLRLQGLHIKWIPMENNVKIGKQVFVHGQQYGTENPAKQAIVRSHRNVVMFHHHKHVEWAGFSDLDSHDKTRSVCVPCFCNRAPLYLKGRANAWSNGFYTSIVKPSGNFTSWITETSAKGHFLTPDGKEYK